MTHPRSCERHGVLWSETYGEHHISRGCGSHLTHNTTNMTLTINFRHHILSLVVTCFMLLPVASRLWIPTGSTQMDVTIPANNLNLEGTLRLLDASHWLAPGAILIHGSGAHTRDEVLPGQLGITFGFGIPVFAEIGDALVEKGIAVLTYDKRNCGSFNKCTFDNSYPFPDLNATIDTFMDDALAAATFLEEREEV